MKLANCETIRTYKQAGYLTETSYPEHHFIYYNINSFCNTIFFYNQSNGHVSDMYPVIENSKPLAEN